VVFLDNLFLKHREHRVTAAEGKGADSEKGHEEIN
jgi:hypothetical protein